MIELDVEAMNAEKQQDKVLRHLFIVRHGHYNDDGLNDIGRQQMRVIASNIKNIVNNSSIYIMSSDVTRAVQSAEVIASELSLPKEFERSGLLFDSTDENTIKFIYEKITKAQALVTVGNLDFVNSFPEIFYRKEIGEGVRIREISKGEAVHIDLEKRIYQILPQ